MPSHLDQKMNQESKLDPDGSIQLEMKDRLSQEFVNYK